MKTTLTTVLPLVGVGQNPGSSILGLLESLRSGIVADQLGGITGIAVAGGALIAAVVLLKIANDYMQGQGITLWSVIRPVVLLMLIMNFNTFFNVSFYSPKMSSRSGTFPRSSSMLSTPAFMNPDNSFNFLSASSRSITFKNPRMSRTVPMLFNTWFPVKMDTSLFLTAPYAILAAFAINPSSSFCSAASWNFLKYHERSTTTFITI